MPAELAQSRLARLKETVESARPVEFEDQRGGIQFHHNFYPVLGANGRVTAIACFSQDIAKRKQAETEVRRQIEELRITNEELARFNRAMVDRELRMIELKKQVNELCVQAGQPPRYPLDFEKETT